MPVLINELKSKTINIRMSESDYLLLEKIRYNHNISISQLVRDAIIFYGIYYTNE